MKKYRLLVSFGDGIPKPLVVESACGRDAVDAALALCPGSRGARLLGLAVEEEMICDSGVLRATESDQSTPIAVKDSKGIVNKDELLKKAKAMRTAGQSYSCIASALDVGKTTVRRWLAKENCY